MRNNTLTVILILLLMVQGCKKQKNIKDVDLQIDEWKFNCELTNLFTGKYNGTFEKVGHYYHNEQGVGPWYGTTSKIDSSFVSYISDTSFSLLDKSNAKVCMIYDDTLSIKAYVLPDSTLVFKGNCYTRNDSIFYYETDDTTINYKSIHFVSTFRVKKY